MNKLIQEVCKDLTVGQLRERDGKTDLDDIEPSKGDYDVMCVTFATEAKSLLDVMADERGVSPAVFLHQLVNHALWMAIVDMPPPKTGSSFYEDEEPTTVDEEECVSTDRAELDLYNRQQRCAASPVLPLFAKEFAEADLDMSKTGGSP